MALVFINRAQETATANTTVDFTLLGAVAGFQSFANVGNTNTTYYAATDTTGSWEVGIGTYSTTGPTLTRTTILSSTNSNTAVTFSGVVTVFVTYPSEKAVIEDASNNVSLPAQLSLLAPALTSSNTSNLDVGGPMGFSDTGVLTNFVGTTNSYLQSAIQNKSAGTSASAEWIAYNDANSATTYAAFGINSSGYTGTGAINAPNAGFFVTGSQDLVLGTVSSNAIHLVINSGATDAMTISTSGFIGMGTTSPLAQLAIAGTGYSPNLTISDAGTLAWNTALGQVATFTFVTSNRAMGTPTNLVNGAFYSLAIVQNAGSNTITSWASAFKWSGGVAPVLSTGAGARDFFIFRSDGTNLYQQGQSLAVA